MQRKFCITAVCMMFLLSGCGDSRAAVPVSKQIDVVRESETVQTEAPTEPPVPTIAERAELFASSENPHIYDECGACSRLETELYSSYLEWLASSRMITACVVLTEQLDGHTPAEFARSYYETISGNTDGFLILINNDTYQDYVYTSGNCQKWIAQADITSALAQATPALIEKRYADAFERLLVLGEQVPAYVLGWTDVLTNDEIQEFSGLAEAHHAAVILFSFPDEEDALHTKIASWTEKISAETFLIIDPQKKQCRIQGNISDGIHEEIMKIMETETISQGIRKFFEKMQN